jgi:hypothetical protein
MKPWDAKTDEQRRVERVARALMVAEGKSTQPDDVLVFLDPFNWDGDLSTPPGSYRTDEVRNDRPAWTGFRIIRMANAAIAAHCAAEGAADGND